MARQVRMRRGGKLPVALMVPNKMKAGTMLAKALPRHPGPSGRAGGPLHKRPGGGGGSHPPGERPSTSTPAAVRPIWSSPNWAPWCSRSSSSLVFSAINQPQASGSQIILSRTNQLSGPYQSNHYDYSNGNLYGRVAPLKPPAHWSARLSARHSGGSCPRGISAPLPASSAAWASSAGGSISARVSLSL